MRYIIIIIWEIYCLTTVASKLLPCCILDGVESGDNTWFRFTHMSMFLRGQYLDMHGEEMKKSQFQKSLDAV